jgi:hypothetical protein
LKSPTRRRFTAPSPEGAGIPPAITILGPDVTSDTHSGYSWNDPVCRLSNLEND